MFKSKLLEILESDKDQIIGSSLEDYWEGKSSLSHHDQIITRVQMLEQLLIEIDKGTTPLEAYIKQRKTFDSEFWPIELY